MTSENKSVRSSKCVPCVFKANMSNHQEDHHYLTISTHYTKTFLCNSSGFLCLCFLFGVFFLFCFSFMCVCDLLGCLFVCFKKLFCFVLFSDIHAEIFFPWHTYSVSFYPQLSLPCQTEQNFIRFRFLNNENKNDTFSLL